MNLNVVATLRIIIELSALSAPDVLPQYNRDVKRREAKETPSRGSVIRIDTHGDYNHT